MADEQHPPAATNGPVDPHEHVVDKAGWLPGPWLDEPDRVQWTTEVGLPGLVVRNRMTGALCGYAAVAADHPLYGHGYEDPDVSVHGGLTYANRCQERGPICHVPAPGEPDDVWWFGFDCAHGFDLCPGMESRLPAELRGHPSVARDVYRDLPYVRDQVEQLAAQLVEVGRG